MTCPCCSSDDITSTTMGGIFGNDPYRDNNRSHCLHCGHKGRTGDWLRINDLRQRVHDLEAAERARKELTK